MAQGCSSPSDHGVLWTTLTRPPSLRTASWVRNFAIGAGRRNRAWPGVTLAMAPLISARPGFGRKLMAPFDIETSPTETIYLVSRTKQARDRRIGALRRWIVDAVDRAR
ncbi:hypothetical protein [Bradyrhizobium sp. URHD0069]|uniref:hypothetical protein n=1 Tax=Bradyrhizobium sp. URHD0069 TaxID=1380355 RepID=UPI001AEBA889|nr:hypothetical protein [Bradyrhizobium sp. URHD0069]